MVEQRPDALRLTREIAKLDPLHGVRAILRRWAGTTSPIGSGPTQHGPEAKDDPKSAAWLWFEVRHQYQVA
jgi:hypothetical protein